MRTPEASISIGYYFALPRLIGSFRGGSPRRSEHSAVEAHIAGTLVHAITFVFAARLLLGTRPAWQQILLLVAVALVVWIWWSCFFYVSSLVTKLLRSAGLLREMPERHAQSLMVGIVTTVFAWQLVTAGTWTAVLGWIWLAAVVLNFIAAAVLSLRHAEPER